LRQELIALEGGRDDGAYPGEGLDLPGRLFRQLGEPAGKGGRFALSPPIGPGEGDGQGYDRGGCGDRAQPADPFDPCKRCILSHSALPRCRARLARESGLYYMA